MHCLILSIIINLIYLYYVYLKPTATHTLDQVIWIDQKLDHEDDAVANRQQMDLIAVDVYDQVN